MDTMGTPDSRPPAVSADIRVVVIDNYDSFTYNLVQYLAELSANVAVFRNDRVSVRGIRRERPTHLVISPGPCTPDDAGVSLEAIRTLSGHLPILGVCLGHQAIGQVFGGKVVRAKAPVHGKTSLIHHDGRTIFAGLPEPFAATRYHSLVVAPRLPESLECSAHTVDGVVMGLRHRMFVVEGVQFHPESLLTLPGKDLLRNFLDLSGGYWNGAAT
jgi:para-aminobenzoate synthetase component II